MAEQKIFNGNLTVDDSGKVTCTSSEAGNININGNTISSTSGDINITPLAGNDVVIDGHWEYDGATLKGLTNLDTTITAYAGKSVKVESVYFEDGSITLFSAAGDHTIDCIGGAGSGRPFILNGANASTTGGSPLNGGDIILDTGHNLFNGDDGEFYVKINNVTKCLIDTDGDVYMVDVYSKTSGSSANMYIDSNGLFHRSTCGAFYKENIRELEAETSGIYDITIKTFEEKSTGKTYNSIIADENSFNHLPEAVIKAKVKLDEDDNVVKNVLDKDGEIIPFKEEETTEIYDSLNWNFITTSLLVEMKKLQDRIKILENK